MNNVSSRITDMVRRFDDECEAQGHSFALNPARDGWLYCQGCGAAKEKKATKEAGK
jgi:hypothetical protein